MRVLLLTIATAFLLTTSSFEKPHKSQSAITLTGTTSNGNAVLQWTLNDPSITVDRYTVLRKENAGNLKNYWATIAVETGDIFTITVPLQKGTNTFEVSAHDQTTGQNSLSNAITLK